MKDRFGWSQLFLFCVIAVLMAVAFLWLYEHIVLRTLLMVAAVLLPAVLLDRPRRSKRE